MSITIPQAVSDAGVAMIKHFETLKLDAYPDPGTLAEPWTIGWGHTGRDVSPGLIITVLQAERLLARDLARAVCDVTRLVRVSLSQTELDALASFTFNVGAANLAKSTLLKRLNAGDYSAVPEQLKLWNRAAGRVLPGLVARRAAEADRWLGDWLPSMSRRLDPPPEPGPTFDV